MKILMLNYEFPPLGGGAANATAYLLRELAQDRAVFVDVVTSSSSNRYEKEQFSKRIRIFKLNVNKRDAHYWRANELLCWSVKATSFIETLLKENHYNLCHCWFGWPTGLIGYHFKETMPYIVSLRGSDVPGFSPRLKLLDKLIFKKLSQVVWMAAAHVTANSLGLKTLAHAAVSVHIEVIPNGVDSDRFAPADPPKKGDKIRMVAVGRLVERKGYGYLLNALKDIKAHFELVIVGDGVECDDLKKTARKQNIPVRFDGFLTHDAVVTRLKQAELFVSPSLNEGMSNAVLEAMSCGLPIIATDVGGAKELIQGNGLIVEKGSVENLKKALKTYRGNRSLLIEHGTESRRIAEQMPWSKTAARYLEVYRAC